MRPLFIVSRPSGQVKLSPSVGVNILEKSGRKTIDDALVVSRIKGFPEISKNCREARLWIPNGKLPDRLFEEMSKYVRMDVSPKISGISP